jgi:hypothetical protein
MLDEPLQHLQAIIQSAASLLSSYFQQKIHFSKVIQLSEAERRNLILRLIIDNASTNMPQSIILKQTVLENKDESESENLSRFARDWAGIEFLTQIGGHYAPIFYAGSLEYKFILIEDLGEAHPSLVGPLTRAPSPLNRQKARTALETYITTIGKMHADASGKSHLFYNLLKKVYPQAELVHRLPANNIDYTLEQFKKLIDIKEVDELRQELNIIHDFVNQPSEFYTLLHGDICPDNVYFQGNQMRLIDFEYGNFGNALIDGVFLRMCMPSCWCAKATPNDILNQMETIYRLELKNKIPLAHNDAAYFKNFVFACAYWIIRSMITLDKFDLIDHELIGNNGPLEPDSLWEPEKNASRPRILSRLQTFISVATECELLPHFRLATSMLLTYLEQIWSETDFLELYPVFR